MMPQGDPLASTHPRLWVPSDHISHRQHPASDPHDAPRQVPSLARPIDTAVDTAKPIKGSNERLV